MKALVTNIEYDTDGQKIKLPKVLEFDVPIDMDEEELLDFVADEISNITGFCHKSFKVSFMKTGDKINIIYNKNEKYKEAFSSYNVEVLELTSEKLYFLDKGLKCSRLLSDFEKDF